MIPIKSRQRIPNPIIVFYYSAKCTSQMHKLTILLNAPLSEIYLILRVTFLIEKDAKFLSKL